MTAKHTPGKWHIGMKPGPIVYGPNGEQVADLRADMVFPEETIANARLIAAAPDLLAALQRILRAHDSDNNGAVMGEAVLCEMFAAQARAALAKAEGKS